MEETPLVGLAAELAKAKERLREEERKSKNAIQLANKRDEVQFKAIHGLLMVFFLWIASLHGIGIYLFTRGFLLTRLVLDEQSSCNVSPLAQVDGSTSWRTIPGQGCWHPRTFDKAVIIVIDALRFDFTVPYEIYSNPEHSPPHQFHNALTILYELATDQPNNAILFPFIADPPTTTLQRLKGLTTGTLPTFIDAGSNFAGTTIEEDNIILQLRNQSKRIAFLGDDTWVALFGRHFEQNLTYPYDSLNVWDLHTVDNGVNEHIFPLLDPEQSKKWDVLIGHYLGVDHAGHRYGPDHLAMNTKLKQMDGVIRNLVEAIDDDTLLIVMGDHGMDPKGDHGGESQSEVEAALWMYSRKGIFGTNTELSPHGKPPRPVAQIDLVPTLALLLGVPIPFNNLGAPIPEAFLGPSGDHWENLVEVTRITNTQIKRYQKQYAFARGEEVEHESLAYAYWRAGEAEYSAIKEGSAAGEDTWKNIYRIHSIFQAENLRVCKDLWARFDLFSMCAGIAVLVGSIAALVLFGRGINGNSIEVIGLLLQRIATGMSIGVLIAFTSGFLFSSGLSLSRLNTTLLGAALGSLAGFSLAVHYIRRRLGYLWPTSTWGGLAVLFTVGHALLFASNSFTIWEDKILNFFLATFGVGGLIHSSRQKDLTSKALGTYHSAVFLLLTRIASLSQLCREEQMPFCKSTFYASATSSVSSPYSLLLLFLLAAALPAIIKSFYMRTKSYEGPASFWIGFSFRLGLLLNATYWTLDSADNGNWFPVDEKLIKAVKMLVAQVVLALGFIAGQLGFAWTQVCLGLEVKQNHRQNPPPMTNSEGEKSKPQIKESVVLLGYSNLHGTRFLLLLISWSLCLILVQKPLGGVSIGVLVWQILNVLEILDFNNLTTSAIGPVVLGILGNSHFFSTGHQATLASIQWESAFIPFSTIVYPWSPLLILLNTVGPQILTALSVPLLALWKKEPKSAGMLSNVAVTSATFLLYHVVVSGSAAACAGWLRRHLMLHKIFSPRFMLGGVVLLVVDVVVSIIAVGALRWNVPAVAEVFGYLY